MPSILDRVQIYEVLSEGVQGNLPSSGLTVTPISDPVLGREEVGLSGITTTPAVNGEDPETLEFIRNTTPRFFASGKRAITRQDWKSIGIRFQGAKDINIWAEYENGPDYRVMYHVVVSLLMASGEITEVDKRNFQTYMDRFRHVSTRILFSDPVALPVDVSLTTYIESGYSHERIKQEVTLKIQTFFSLKLGVIGRVVYLSDLMGLVLSVEGVNYAVFTDPTDTVEVERNQYATLSILSITTAPSSR